MSGTVNVDTLVVELRGLWESTAYEDVDWNDATAAFNSRLSDLAARAREARAFEEAEADANERAEAAEADRDRLREELAESRRHADGMARAPYGEFESMREARDRLARRVAELEQTCEKAIRERRSLESKEDDWHRAYERSERRVAELSSKEPRKLDSELRKALSWALATLEIALARIDTIDGDSLSDEHYAIRQA